MLRKLRSGELGWVWAWVLLLLAISATIFLVILTVSRDGPDPLLNVVTSASSGVLLAAAALRAWLWARDARIEYIDREFTEREQQQSSGSANASTLKDLLFLVEQLDEAVADDNISPERAFDALRSNIERHLRAESGLRIAPDGDRDGAK